MERAIEETARRREKQERYNSLHGIVPRSTTKSFESPLDSLYQGDEKEKKTRKALFSEEKTPKTVAEMTRRIQSLEAEMRSLARDLEFEKAAMIRDHIRELQKQMLLLEK